MNKKSIKQKIADLRVALRSGIILSLKTYKAENTAITKITTKKGGRLTASNPPYKERWVINNAVIEAWHKELNL